MKKLIVANWKLHGNIKMINNYLHFLNFTLSNQYFKHSKLVIVPPAVYLERMFQGVLEKKIFIGAQNVDLHETGAFTGEISILMMREIGIKYVITGHSERRLLHNENNQIVAKKFHLIKKNKLIPILCVGETEKEKKDGKTKEIIKEQLDWIIKTSGIHAFENTVIAYEPIWSIGTGLSSTPQDIQLVCNFITSYIEKISRMNLNNTIIQYGGSINSLNVKNIVQKTDINGLLIGSASLNIEELFKIIKIVNNVVLN